MPGTTVLYNTPSSNPSHRTMWGLTTTARVCSYACAQYIPIKPWCRTSRAIGKCITSVMMQEGSSSSWKICLQTFIGVIGLDVIVGLSFIGRISRWLRTTGLWAHNHLYSAAIVLLWDMEVLLLSYQQWETPTMCLNCLRSIHWMNTTCLMQYVA